MATLIKQGARKNLNGGKIMVGYGNLSFPGLLERKHISLNIGDHIIRENFEEAERVAKEILDTIAQYRNEK